MNPVLIVLCRICADVGSYQVSDDVSGGWVASESNFTFLGRSRLTTGAFSHKHPCQWTPPGSCMVPSSFLCFCEGFLSVIPPLRGASLLSLCIAFVMESAGNLHSYYYYVTTQQCCSRAWTASRQSATSSRVFPPPLSISYTPPPCITLRSVCILIVLPAVLIVLARVLLRAQQAPKDLLLVLISLSIPSCAQGSHSSPRFSPTPADGPPAISILDTILLCLH